jgi:hypothetical protein
MALSQGEKFMCGVALAAAVFAIGMGVRGCGGNPGEGAFKVDPKVKAKYGKGPHVQPPAVKKIRPERRGIKSRLPGGVGVK